MPDPIYANVQKGQESLYQRFFEEIVTQIDVENFTAQTQGKPFDRSKLQSDYKIVESVANRARQTHSLLPVVLQVMTEQYFWADAIQREKHKHEWIYRVMRRRDTDFFPDSLAIYNNLFRD